MSKAIFINETTLQVKCDNTDEINILFGSPMNYIVHTRFPDKDFVKLTEKVFDKYYSGNPHFVMNEYSTIIFNLGWEIPCGYSPNKIQERVRIGNRIKELRKNKNIDAKHLAELTGIDAANLCRIEQGKLSVGLDTLVKIASALGARVDFNEIKE